MMPASARVLCVSAGLGRSGFAEAAQAAQGPAEFLFAAWAVASLLARRASAAVVAMALVVAMKWRQVRVHARGPFVVGVTLAREVLGARRSLVAGCVLRSGSMRGRTGGVPSRRVSLGDGETASC